MSKLTTVSRKYKKNTSSIKLFACESFIVWEEKTDINLY